MFGFIQNKLIKKNNFFKQPSPTWGSPRPGTDIFHRNFPWFLPKFQRGKMWVFWVWKSDNFSKSIQNRRGRENTEPLTYSLILDSFATPIPPSTRVKGVECGFFEFWNHTLVFVSFLGFWSYKNCENCWKNFEMINYTISKKSRPIHPYIKDARGPRKDLKLVFDSFLSLESWKKCENCSKIFKGAI